MTPETALPQLVTNQLSSVVVGVIAFYFFWKVSSKFSDTVTNISNSYADSSNMLSKKLQELSDSNRELTVSNEKLVKSNEDFLKSNSILYERLWKRSKREAADKGHATLRA